jgi:hypothetical protein
LDPKDLLKTRPEREGCEELKPLMGAEESVDEVGVICKKGTNEDKWVLRREGCTRQREKERGSLPSWWKITALNVSSLFEGSS